MPMLAKIVLNNDELQACCPCKVLGNIFSLSYRCKKRVRFFNRNNIKKNKGVIKFIVIDEWLELKIQL